MKKRTTQLLAELKTLSASAVENLYRRIGLAAEVMGDLDWIAATHGGSDLKAADALQDEYFRDLGGYVSLGKLIAMYRKVSVQQWEEVRYDVAAVEVLYDGLDRQTQEKGERTAWKPIAEERGEEIERLKRRIAELEAQNKVLVEEIGRLREENADLLTTVARLEGRIEEMERRQPVLAR